MDWGIVIATAPRAVWPVRGPLPFTAGAPAPAAAPAARSARPPTPAAARRRRAPRPRGRSSGRAMPERMLEIGIMPMNASTNSAMTRPRRWPGTAIWIDVLVSELEASSAAPASVESARVSGSQRDSAKPTSSTASAASVNGMRRSRRSAGRQAGHDERADQRAQAVRRHDERHRARQLPAREAERGAHDRGEQRHVGERADGHDGGAEDEQADDAVLARVAQAGGQLAPRVQAPVRASGRGGGLGRRRRAFRDRSRCAAGSPRARR